MATKAIEKATGVEYNVKAIEGGYEIFTLEGEKYKKVKESTFKRYFKLVKEEKAEEEAKATTETGTKEKTPHTELSDEKKEQVIDKIKKLLNLSENNPSQEEALSAALQAQKLMAKYNIHEDDVTLEEIKDDIDSFIAEQKHNSQLHSWRKVLATIVAKNFRCKCYLQGRKDVAFRGYTADAKIALEVYTYLYTIGDKLGSKEYQKQLAATGSGKGVYNSFVTGFLTGIEEGFSTQCTALMVVTPKEVEEEYAQFSASFTKGKTTKLHVDNIEAYNKGKEEGKAAIKSRGIEKK